MLLACGASFAQQQVNLTAAPTTTTLPDGTVVPMWGYTCTGVSGTALTSGAQTCARLSKSTASAWSPIVITVPTGQDLTINLTNNLQFGTTKLPTSMVIVGQLGGGLGTTATSTASPAHNPLTATWPVSDSALNTT